MLEIFGGPDRDRTDDLFHAMEARSQLRHRPTLRGSNSPIVYAWTGFVKPARWAGMEPDGRDGTGSDFCKKRCRTVFR
jgi:hypothetical protein